MNLARLIPFVMLASVILTVLALGLHSKLLDAIALVRRPGLMLRSIVSMYFVMVVVVGAAASLFPLAPTVKLAIVALAVSPVPPTLPGKQQKAGGSSDYAVGLMVVAVLLAIVLVPVWIELIGRYFHADVHMSPGRIAPTVFLSAIAPLFVGMMVRRIAPDFAARIEKPISLVAAGLLAAAALPIMFTMSGAIWTTIGHGVLVVLALFTLVGLATGHLLGGPYPDDRTVLALATSTRHPGIALAIIALNFPEQKKAVMAVVLLHLIVGGVIAIPYKVWRSRSRAKAAKA